MKSETHCAPRGLAIGLSREVAPAFAVRITQNQTNHGGGFINTTSLSTNAPRPARWMIVDDNADLLALMQAMLAQIYDGSVDCFSSPADALAAFADKPDQYEVVITDYEMPGMDGIQLGRRLHERARDLKIFLATGSGFFTTATAARAGFLGLLNKPFHLEELRAMLAGAGVSLNETVAA